MKVDNGGCALRNKFFPAPFQSLLRLYPNQLWPVHPIRHQVFVGSLSASSLLGEILATHHPARSHSATCPESHDSPSHAGRTWKVTYAFEVRVDVKLTRSNMQACEPVRSSAERALHTLFKSYQVALLSQNNKCRWAISLGTERKGRDEYLAAPAILCMSSVRNHRGGWERQGGNF